MTKETFHGYEESLQDKNLKLTHPRQAILEKIMHNRPGEHFSADELWEWFRKRGDKISKATVYRTLNLLVQEKLVEEHDFGKGQKYYERMAERPHHDHLICMQCGRILEFENTQIEKLQEEVAQQEGFSISYHSHKLFGTCSVCRSKGRAPKPST